MVYRVIGIMSGSSLDGLDIAFVELHENAGKWDYEIVKADCYPYSPERVEQLRSAVFLSARDYQLLHTEFGHYIGRQVNHFIEENDLHYQVALVSSHGHTTFHIPSKKTTCQLGDGAAIAAGTGLPVVTDLRALDVALGGEGAPIVPIGEKLLLKGFDYFLNLGGIANLSVATGTNYLAFDICPANAVLNLLAKETGMEFDEDGKLASSGSVHSGLLEQLNALDYYRRPSPKSLANDFGTTTVFPVIKRAGISINDALSTYVEHIAIQVSQAIKNFGEPGAANPRMLATGGGAFNAFLIKRIKHYIEPPGIELIIPDENLVKYKEALVMAFIGVLRWRQEYNVLASVTGAMRDSIGGALWNGQEA